RAAAGIFMLHPGCRRTRAACSAASINAIVLSLRGFTMESNDGYVNREPVDPRLERPISRQRLIQGTLAGAAALGAAGVLPGLDSVSAGTFQAPAAAPKRGGRLRVGMVGGGTSETLDPNRQVNEIDTARSHILYERLVDFKPDGSLFYQLAEDFSPNK